MLDIGFAGMAVDEERALSDAYRAPRLVRKLEGQGPNDLHLRFFRMAERRIAAATGRGVACFVSNYSRLDGLSFTAMRERYPEAFDAARIDCPNRDKYKTGKVATDGSPDPSVFSTEGDPVGIQVGTAIAAPVRKGDRAPAPGIGFRHLWGRGKRAELLATTEAAPGALYDEFAPSLPRGLPVVRAKGQRGMVRLASAAGIVSRILLGVKTGCGRFLIDIDLDRPRARFVAKRPGNDYDFEIYITSPRPPVSAAARR